MTLSLNILAEIVVSFRLKLLASKQNNWKHLRWMIPINNKKSSPFCSIHIYHRISDICRKETAVMKVSHTFPKQQTLWVWTCVQLCLGKYVQLFMPILNKIHSEDLSVYEKKCRKINFYVHWNRQSETNSLLAAN